MKRKRILNTMLSISTALSFMLVNPLTVNATNQTTGGGTPLTNSFLDRKDYILDTGNYYLNSNLEINNPIVIKDEKEVTLDLNGYVLQLKEDSNAPSYDKNKNSVIKVGQFSNAKLTITDTSINSPTRKEHYFTENENGLWVLEDSNSNSSSHIVKGGVITSTAKNVEDGGAIYVNTRSQLAFNGGNIIGCQAECGGAIKLNSSSELTIGNASIRGCQATSLGGAIHSSYANITMNNSNSVIDSCQTTSSYSDGGAIYASGTFSLYNGKITNCYSKGNGCSISAQSCTINIINGEIDTCTKNGCNNPDIYLSDSHLRAHGGIINGNVKLYTSTANNTNSIINFSKDSSLGYTDSKLTHFKGKVEYAGTIKYGIFYNELTELTREYNNKTSTGVIDGKKITFMKNDTEVYAIEVLGKDTNNNSSKTGTPLDPKKAGFTFAGWYEKINGNYKQNPFVFGEELTENITLYPTWIPNAYIPEIIEGKNQTFKHGETNDLSFKSNDSYDNFNSVKVDGNFISDDKYDVRKGSIIVTLKNSYLNTLSEGSHTLSIVSTNGEASTSFTITRDNNNQSGNTNTDNNNNPSSSTNNGQGNPSNGTNNGEDNPTLKPSTGDTNQSTTNTSDKNNVKTGDNTNIVIWTLGLLIGLFGIVYNRKENA